ncbi:MAG: hypothetical protein RLY30_1925 [Pseudomonadota bacterium]|jgi:long-chain fatty acid transport protein
MQVSIPRKTALQLGLAAALLSLTAGSAWATNGYFAHGYGTKARGMGGAAVALAQDGFAGANNPAAAAFAGNRWDVGADLFAPDRSASRTGGTGPMGPYFAGEATSKEKAFVIPEFGYNLALSDSLGLGLSVYGNGGMNTTYKTPGGCVHPTYGQMNLLCGNPGHLGVDLMQLIVAPSLAYKVDANHSIGISPLFVYQRFEAKGLQAFQGTFASLNPMAPPVNISSDPMNMTDRGYDSSTGFGVRLGFMGKPTKDLTVGLSYAPKINMSSFDSYAGLFAGGGDFDIPANASIGIALQASPEVLVALDFQRIEYSGVPSIANASSRVAAPLQALMQGATNVSALQMGGAQGGGFGWKDISVIKLGVQWQVSSKTTLRAGFNKGQNPISEADVTVNILAPGVMTKHYTLGATYQLSKTSELSWSFMIAPEVKVSAPSLFEGFGFPAGTDTIRMKQTSAGVQYSSRF